MPAALAPLFNAADRAPWSRPLIVFAATFLYALWFMHVRVPADPGNIPDFTIFYAAATPGPIYDAEWLSGLQRGPGLRPFAYPPTFLLICKPLALLPLEFAYALWVAVSATLFVEATGQLVRRAPWLVMLSPLFLLAVGMGQTSLLIGALVVFGMSRLSQPVLAGVLFGIAFSLKPQVLLLLPVALALARCWRALIAMGLAGLAVCLLSLVHGPALWLAWAASLAEFSAINNEMGLWRMSAPAEWRPAAALLALACLHLTTRADIPTRLIAIIAGSLLISPHARTYETAMLLPAALGLLCRLEWRSLAALPMLYVRFVPPWGLALYLVIVCLGARRRQPPPHRAAFLQGDQA